LSNIIGATLKTIHTHPLALFLLGGVVAFAAVFPNVARFVEDVIPTDAIIQVSVPVFLQALFLLCWFERRKVIALVRNNPALVGLYALAIISATVTGVTSDNANLFYSLHFLVLTCLLGVFFAVTYSPSEQLTVWSVAFVLVAVTSLIFAFVRPASAFHLTTHMGDLRGLMLHKNILGSVMSFGCGVLLMRALTAGRWRAKLITVLGLGIVTATLLLTTSRLGFVTAVAAYALPGVWAVSRRVDTRILWRVVLISGAVGCAAVITLLPTIRRVLLHDEFMFGRVMMYESLPMAVAARPILGYGYRNGYDELWEQFPQFVQQYNVWKAPHAHNGLLDTAIYLGFSGVALLLWVMITYGVRALRAAYTPNTHCKNWLSVWWLVMLLMFVLGNTLDTMIWSSLALLQNTVMIAMGLSLARSGTLVAELVQGNPQCEQR
jgi:exopolysaccharide production protein ExoQ